MESQKDSNEIDMVRFVGAVQDIDAALQEPKATVYAHVWRRCTRCSHPAVVHGINLNIGLMEAPANSACSECDCAHYLGTVERYDADAVSVKE